MDVHHQYNALPMRTEGTAEEMVHLKDHSQKIQDPVWKQIVRQNWDALAQLAALYHIAVLDNNLTHNRLGYSLEADGAQLMQATHQYQEQKHSGLQL